MASKDCSSNYADDVLAKLEDVGGLTPLQKHAAFFDRNKDGKIYPRETYQGFRAIGCGVALSVAAAVFINGTLGIKTKPGKFPSILFPIYVKNIKKGIHGSDTGAYDTEGRFVSEKFEEIFKKHALTNCDAITKEELKQMLRANRDPKDYSGRFASFVEWTVLYSLCKDENGLVHRESVRAVYDGSIFIKLEKERTDAKKRET